MYNQPVYVVNGRQQVRVYQQPSNYLGSQRNQRVIVQPQQYRPPAPQVTKLIVVDGILIQNQYQPEKGDPIIIEQVIFKGQIVQVGDKKKQVIPESEAILTGEGNVSEDGKLWKHLPSIKMSVFKLGQLSIKNVTKLKAKYDNSIPHHKVMKLSYKDTDYYLAFKESEFNQWFLRVVWAKLVLQKKQYADFGNWQTQVTGKIYKKSQILGQWEPRVVTIDSRSLRSSKDSTSAVSLQITATKQIWTRFQEIKGGYYLVVKLWYGIIKLQFAVPTTFCLKWLNHFLGLLAL